MSDLPTREEAADIVRMRDDPNNYDSGTENEYLAPFRVFRAYANGDLLTRAEWEATIDVEDLIADLYGCLIDPHMGGDLDAKCVRKVLAEHGIREEKT